MICQCRARNKTRECFGIDWGTLFLLLDLPAGKAKKNVQKPRRQAQNRTFWQEKRRKKSKNPAAKRKIGPAVRKNEEKCPKAPPSSAKSDILAGKANKNVQKLRSQAQNRTCRQEKRRKMSKSPVARTLTK